MLRVGVEVAFAVEGGGGGDVVEVVGVDEGGGVVVVRFDAGGCEGLGEGCEVGGRERGGDEEGAGQGFFPEVREAVGAAGEGVVVEGFVGDAGGGVGAC